MNSTARLDATAPDPRTVVRRERLLRACLGIGLAASLAAALIGVWPGAPIPALPPWSTALLGGLGAAACAAAWRLLAALRDEREAREARMRALQHSQNLFATLVATSPDVMTLTDMATGRYVMVNEAFCRFSGWTKDEAIGHSAFELGIWADPVEREQLIGQLRHVGSAADLDLHFRTKQGEVRPLLVSAAHFRRGEKTYLVINGRDVTETARIRQEREAILENASVGVAFTRRARFELTNPRFDAIYGWARGELAGREARAVWPDAGQAETYRREVAPALRRGEAVETERWTTRRDGTPFLVRLRAKAIDPLHPGGGGTIWIAEDVTAQRQAEQELARARDAAEAASRAKSAFLANTSHEIRTPLNALVGLARLARDPELDPTRRTLYLDQIGDNAQTLALIISDILDLSKIEAGRLAIESAPFDLRELLDSLCQAYASLAASRNLRFSASIDPAVPTLVQGDALRVRQILSNYLHNALKFTAEGGIRLVVAPAEGDRVRFEVHDTGPGIEAATGARLFTPFTQGDGSTTRRFGGTGLGLAICQQLAVLMNGRVGLESVPGRGSCFHAELPLPIASALDPDSLYGVLDDDPLRGARALLVEDNPVNMMIAVALLEGWGMEVDQAADGEAALAAVDAAERAHRRFDVVLMDLQMPGISGYETTRRLRKHYSSARLPVIALTAAALVSERERALDAGMDDFLTKPLDMRRMRRVLTQALARSRGE